MNCSELYGQYNNQIIEIAFKETSDSYKKFGKRIVGFFMYPIENSFPFYEDLILENNVIYKHQLVRLCFKLTAGAKIKFGISDEIENQLLEQGFPCVDIEKINTLSEMDLEVEGNVLPFLFKGEVEIQSYYVSGIWGSNPQTTRMKFGKKGFKPFLISGDKFYSLCNEIRGCKYVDLPKILLKHRIGFDLSKAHLLEYDLIKALCNIFVWLEYYFIEEPVGINPLKLQANNEFLPKMYDEFVIDYSGEEGSQNDIYLIKQSYLFGGQNKDLEELMKRNLLSKVHVKVRHNRYENYFVPFIKANHDLEENNPLMKTYLNLLRDRHFALTKYFNKK